MGCWASWLSRQTFNLEIRGFESRTPCQVPFVQWIRTERYERSNPSSNLERDTSLRSGGRAAKALHCLGRPGGFDSHPLRHSLEHIDKRLKSPVSQAGYRRFESGCARQVEPSKLDAGNCPDGRRKVATLDPHRLCGSSSLRKRFLGNGGSQRRQQQGNLAMADDSAELALGHQ
jgi:hypothetical protein